MTSTPEGILEAARRQLLAVGYAGLSTRQITVDAPRPAEPDPRPDEQVCIVTVGGSGVGSHLLRRVIAAQPEVRTRVPDLRMVVVAGPRIDPRTCRHTRLWRCGPTSTSCTATSRSATWRSCRVV